MESSNLRGIASIGGRFQHDSILFISEKRANGIAADSSSGKPLTFSSFIETGYHRTASDWPKKPEGRNFKGGHLNFRGNFFSLGATAYAVSYDGSFEPKSAYIISLPSKENTILQWGLISRHFIVSYASREK